MNSSVMIRRARISDINQIAKLHMRNLKDGLLYSLGEDTLKLFYNDLLADKRSLVFLFEEKNKIFGVAASTKDANSFFKEFKRKNMFRLIPPMISKSVKDPIFPLRLAFSQEYPEVPEAELLILFVDASLRGRNIGTKLVRRTIEWFRKEKVNKFKITILSKNVKGKDFYKKMGFRNAGKFNYINEAREIYAYNLNRAN